MCGLAYLAKVQLSEGCPYQCGSQMEGCRPWWQTVDLRTSTCGISLQESTLQLDPMRNRNHFHSCCFAGLGSKPGRCPVHCQSCLLKLLVVRLAYHEVHLDCSTEVGSRIPDRKLQQGLLATYLIPGCIGRGVKLGSESSSIAVVAGIWKSGHLEFMMTHDDS